MTAARFVVIDADQLRAGGLDRQWPLSPGTEHVRYLLDTQTGTVIFDDDIAPEDFTLWRDLDAIPALLNQYCGEEGRFEVITNDQLLARGLDSCWPPATETTKYVLDTATSLVVFDDDIAPENRTLARDLSFLPDALNKLTGR